MELNRIKAALLEALRLLYKREAPIIVCDAHERTITARLARYLKGFFPDYAVHHEYNRHGVDPKEIDLPGTDGLLTRVHVAPDIIVHEVGHDGENILVIEAKKQATRPRTASTSRNCASSRAAWDTVLRSFSVCR